MKFLLVVVVFWMGIGLYTIKQAMEDGDEKVSNLKFKDGVKIMLKSLFFGPYTRTKVLTKL